MSAETTIKKISEKMRKDFPFAETYLYGSQARGEATPDSDIDLLILLPDSEVSSDWRELKYSILDAVYDIEIDELANVSALVLLKSVWQSKVTPFTINVNRDAIRL